VTQINTVLGPVDSDDLGFTLMHEHLIVAAAGITEDYPDLLGKDMLERVVSGLTWAKAGGVQTVVDVTTLDLGRNVSLMAEASQRSGVNVIACTGWYTGVPWHFVGLSPNKLADEFVREIQTGISGTGIKAGILKGASDVKGVTRLEETVLRALARAHMQTGVPIALHSYAAGEVARRQIAILREEGVPLNGVKIDHCNDTTDTEYLQWILEQGCWLGMDRYPGPLVSPLARTRTMKALIDAGWAHRLCPSHDWTLAYILREEAPGQGRARYFPFRYLFNEHARQESNPQGLLYMKEIVFPWLREMGVAEPVIRQLCVDNPRHFFEGE
jgi:phosphotriesterase-related protein